MRARVARDQNPQRVGDIGEERRGQPAGRGRGQGVAVEAGLIGGDVPLLAAEAQADRPPFALEPGRQRLPVDRLKDAP
jgi:hypothetical protein